jgi:hypothetical protein
MSLAAAVAAALLALPAAASAADYPPPSNPGATQSRPKGPFRTLTVCAPKGRKAKGCFRTIQRAVDKARAGDSVRLPNGTYRQSVRIVGARKRYLRLVGNTRRPGKVVLDGRTLKGGPKQNGVLVNGADEVTVKGITAQNFSGNGFFVVNATGYTLTRLQAFKTGVYGVYAFNSKGGTMSDSVAAWNNDAGFYIGQTPPQTKPIRSFVRNVVAYGNVIGFSGTNMRYVTITKSKWFNNGLGIVPNALDSEKFAPPEDNEIVGNEIFWNNFNYFKGAPFPLRQGATGDIPYPVGVGVMLFGGRRTRVTGNRIYGNYLVGVAAFEQILLKQQDAKDLVGNQVTGNDFGLGGEDLNGRDLAFDGSGRDNCFAPNTMRSPTLPEDGSTLAACPFSGTNAFSQSARETALQWALAGGPNNPDGAEANWLRHPHRPRAGYTPLEHYVRGRTAMRQPGP